MKPSRKDKDYVKIVSTIIKADDLFDNLLKNDWTLYFPDLFSAKGGSDLVWYSIDRDIFKTESIFCRKDKSIQLDLGSVYLDLYSLLIPDIK